MVVFVDAKLLHLRRALTRFDDFRMGKEKLFLENLENISEYLYKSKQ